ncbi:MAG: biopolymer transporter ExbD [Chitinophagaceae bacterium]
MARPVIGRKTPSIDMTAMCDVAFLLLSFFILATKLKPDEAVPVTTPSSVSTQAAPEKDVIQVTINKAGKVFLAIQDKDKKQSIIEDVNTLRKLGLTPDEITKLTKQSLIAVPLTNLKEQAAMNDKQLDEKMPGVAVHDSANNDMKTWMRAVNDTYIGTKNNIVIKGDNVAKYPEFRNVIDAMKANELFQFQLVTNPEAVPAGTLLWEANKGK